MSGFALIGIYLRKGVLKVKRGLKYIFKSWRRFGSGWFAVFCLALAAVMGALPFIMHEPMGDEDYMFPKAFLFFAGLFVTCMGVVCGCRDLALNKLTRSTPIAKELYTRSAPMFVLICDVGVSLVMMCAYFIFLTIIGAEAAQFSDTLMSGAIICLPQLIFMPLCMSKPAGGLWAMYPSILPFIAVMLIGGNKFKLNGFGVPLPIAAAVFAGAVILGAVLVFWISAVSYKKSEVKVYSTEIVTR